MKQIKKIIIAVAIVTATFFDMIPSAQAIPHGPGRTAKPAPAGPTRIALLRLEDVSPWYALNPKRLELLRHIADYLASRHVPFQVAMIPVYVDPAAGIRVGIDTPEDPRAQEFIAAIHYLMSKGGTIGLHGYTHQMDLGVTGASFEFSSDPHAIESTVQYMAPRVDAALAAAKAAGIPVAFWETPHYTASPEQYAYLESRFAIIYEPGPTSHHAREPFLTDSPNRAIGTTCFVPTPLGMVQGPKQVRSIVHFASTSPQKMLASLFFHPFREQLPSSRVALPAAADSRGAYLEQIVPAFQSHGFVFVSVDQVRKQLLAGRQSHHAVAPRPTLP
jgi:hypothetical protein